MLLSAFTGIIVEQAVQKKKKVILSAKC